MYTHDEVVTASLEYFNGNDLAANVFVTKYALRNKDGELLEQTPNDMHHRLADEFHRIERDKFKEPLSYETIYNYLKNFEQIIPQGSPMYGIGNPKAVSLSNCFVIESPYDSYGGICKTDQEIAQISKRRGGVGYDISSLRPSGLGVNNSAVTTTGAVSFMHRFSHTGNEVGQNGRRGAQMISISVHHPDIEQFISIKLNEHSITGANISIKLTDEFMQAVANETTYNTYWNDKIYGTKDAVTIWNKIIHSAWAMAEPGLLFWDNIIRESPADCYPNFTTVSTNPCQPEWAKILTPHSISDIANISIGSKIWSKEGWTTVVNKVARGIKDVYKYTTTAGIFYGTEDHKLVIDDNNTKIQAKNAESINIIAGPDVDIVAIIPEIVMDGVVIGNGSVHKASGNMVGLYIGDNDKDYFDSEIQYLIGEHRPGIKNNFYKITTSITHSELPHTYNRCIPDRYIYGNTTEKCSFLRGIFSANGSVCGNRITLKTSSKIILEEVQLMLSSIGIKSYYTTNMSKKIKFDNGEYICKQNYDLNISTDREKFVNHIGFIQQYKNDKIKLVKGKEKLNYDIISKEYISTEEVFDITVDNKTHTYWSQGCNVANCGEIPLSPHDSCRLLAINLFSCVTDPYTYKSAFDYQKLYDTAKIAQRLMDDLVDLEIEKISQIINKIKGDPEPTSIKQVELQLWQSVLTAAETGRRTGTGITAMGDVLAALGLKYGSKRSIEVVGEIYKTLKLGCYRSSVDMAKELGSFCDYHSDNEKDNPYINRLAIDDPDLYIDMQIYGRRNIALLTTAPTGSVSTQAKIGDNFGTTSGIEPCFMAQYTRRKRVNPSDTNIETTFIDNMGEEWAEFDVYHSGLNEWIKKNPTKDISNSPYYTSCASDINWIARVKLQSAAQQHVDHAISSTINLPNDVQEDEVANIYMTAWQTGLKGITVYRDGCRSGILVAKDTDTTFPDERPRKLPCDVHHISIKGQQYFVLVGLYDGKPYEVFAGKNGFLPKKTKTGTIIRKRKGFYKVIFDDADEELSPITAATDEMEEVVTRLTSGLLRTGADMLFIVQQLEKVGERQTEMYSFARSVSRTLKKYIPDGTKEKGLCPECNSDALVRQEGCITCLSCGYSKCL